MIKILNGIHETVAYDYFPTIKLYHNMEAEDYPLHWHTAMEIIMPVRKEYTVVIDETPHTFGRPLKNILFFDIKLLMYAKIHPF